MHIGALSLDGNFIKDARGRTVATLAVGLDADLMATYGRLFAASPRMRDLLEVLTDEAVSEHEEALAAAQEYNAQQDYIRSAVPGESALFPQLPDWVQDALTLLAELRTGEQSS